MWVFRAKECEDPPPPKLSRGRRGQPPTPAVLEWASAVRTVRTSPCKLPLRGEARCQSQNERGQAAGLGAEGLGSQPQLWVQLGRRPSLALFRG